MSSSFYDADSSAKKPDLLPFAPVIVQQYLSGLLPRVDAQEAEQRLDNRAAETVIWVVHVFSAAAIIMVLGLATRVSDAVTIVVSITLGVIGLTGIGTISFRGHKPTTVVQLLLLLGTLVVGVGLMVVGGLLAVINLIATFNEPDATFGIYSLISVFVCCIIDMFDIVLWIREICHQLVYIQVLRAARLQNPLPMLVSGDDGDDEEQGRSRSQRDEPERSLFY
jgi:hypothetical protein